MSSHSMRAIPLVTRHAAAVVSDDTERHTLPVVRQAFPPGKGWQTVSGNERVSLARSDASSAKASRRSVSRSPVGESPTVASTSLLRRPREPMKSPQSAGTR